MNFYLDTEFHEYAKFQKIPTIELISIGIVTEWDSSYYAISKDFDMQAAWDNQWLRDNVLKSIFADLCKLAKDETTYQFSYTHLTLLLRIYGKTNKQIAEEIKAFVYSYVVDNPDTVTNWDEVTRKSPIKFWAYFADYDWVVFCWLFGRMIDLPKGFPMFCYDLKQSLEYDSLKKDIIPAAEGEHNALSDAIWNKRLHAEILRLHVKKTLESLPDYILIEKPIKSHQTDIETNELYWDFRKGDHVYIEKTKVLLNREIKINQSGEAASEAEIKEFARELKKQQQ